MIQFFLDRAVDGMEAVERLPWPLSGIAIVVIGLPVILAMIPFFITAFLIGLVTRELT